MQLVTADTDAPSIQMIDPLKKDRTTYREVIEKWTVPPEMLGDVLALAGDTADNIPGTSIYDFHCSFFPSLSKNTSHMLHLG
jgi:5'-3' exonuclease